MKSMLINYIACVDIPTLIIRYIIGNNVYHLHSTMDTLDIDIMIYWKFHQPQTRIVNSMQFARLVLWT